MGPTVSATDDPARVLAEAGAFLKGDPVRHNVILTLLENRVAQPEPGRYWIVNAEGAAVGVVFQSPLHFTATVTPMSDEAVEAVVDAIADQQVALPAVSGVAATAARFAGRWTERTKSAAKPVEGNRIYEVDRVVPAAPAPGRIRLAAEADRDLLVEWVTAFESETGSGLGEPERAVDRRLKAKQLWVWDDTEPVSLAGFTHAVAGVRRIGPVYSPPERRGRGYASALVGSVSTGIRDKGDRCILYTDLSNPISNSVYRTLGYRAVAEVIVYAFG